MLAEPGGATRVRPTARIAPRSALYTHTQALARAIKRVTEDVQHLQRLAQRKTLFDDPAAEINTLTLTIKTTLTTLDKAVKELMTRLPSSGSASRSGAAPSHWNAVLAILQGHLASATRDFQNALHTRSETQREQATRRKALARSTWAPMIDENNPLFAQPNAPSAPTDGPTSAPVSAPVSSGGSRPQGPPSFISGGVADSAGRSDGLRRRAPPATIPPIPPIPPELHTGAAARGGMPSSVLGTGPVKLYNRAAPTAYVHASQTEGSHSAYMGHVPATAASYTAAQLASAKDASSRASEMQTVVRNIADLGHLFTRMSALVAEQGETIERIDADMDETLDNVNAGMGELQKFYRNIRGNTSFILKVFAVLLLVVILIAVFRR